MTETLDAPITKGKVYKARALYGATFLGGPLVAGYIFAENFKALNQPEKVSKTWIITILATFLIFLVIFLLPESVEIPNQLIPITYTLLAVGLFKMYQDDKVSNHLNNGGLSYGWGRAALIGIVGFVVTMLPIIAVVYVSNPDLSFTPINSKNYGVIAKHEIAYYESNISESEVDRIAEGLTEIGFFDRIETKYIYAEKSGKKYSISISVTDGTAEDVTAIYYFTELRKSLADFFPENQIEVKLVFESFDNVVKVIQ